MTLSMRSTVPKDEAVVAVVWLTDELPAGCVCGFAVVPLLWREPEEPGRLSAAVVSSAELSAGDSSAKLSGADADAAAVVVGVSESGEDSSCGLAVQALQSSSAAIRAAVRERSGRFIGFLPFVAFWGNSKRKADSERMRNTKRIIYMYNYDLYILTGYYITDYNIVYHNLQQLATRVFCPIVCRLEYVIQFADSRPAAGRRRK